MLAAYQEAREQLLARIISFLRQDERFVAAWLTGSYGRGDADAVSDLDLNIVVADTYAGELCARPRMVQAGTIPPRLVLISQFGKPAILHENHFNAPEKGTFTFVLYADNALMVDWILIPRAQAQYPPTARLLFDKTGITIQRLPVLEPARRLELVKEKSAFFWMMLAVTAKYIVRQDDVKVQGFLDTLHQVLHELECLLDGRDLEYRRGALLVLQPTQDSQRMRCRMLMQRMFDLGPRIVDLGVDLPPTPTETIDRLLNLH